MSYRNYKITLAVSLAIAGLSAGLKAEPEKWLDLLASPGLQSFSPPTGDWTAVGSASMSAANDNLLTTEPGTGVIINGAAGKTQHLLTKMMHGDVEVHVEFMVPRKSNSGVYFQGRYEIQILDSWGIENPGSGDCGGIYQRWKDNKGYDGKSPRKNASLEAGKWQSFDITFRAPRFDENGNKTANAVFVKVVHNGVLIHENEELSGPTRSAAFTDEKPLGPLMFQGDHGPVAFRNLRVKPMND